MSQEFTAQEHIGTDGVLYMTVPEEWADTEVEVVLKPVPKQDAVLRPAPGIDEGQLIIAPDFDDPLPDAIVDAFYGMDKDAP